MDNFYKLIEKYNISEYDLYILNILELHKSKSGFIEKQNLSTRIINILKPYNIGILEKAEILKSLKKLEYHNKKELIEKYGEIKIEKEKSSSKKTILSYIILVGIVIFVFTVIANTIGNNSSTTAECKGEIRAYEFGREMATFSRMSNLSLSNSIDEFSKGLGVDHPYESDNPCVKAGFDDEKNNIESPYNKEGKSWTKF